VKVLQVTPVFAPSVGGVQTATREVARRLPLRSIHTQVLTADATWNLPRDEQCYGVHVTRVRAWPRGGDQLLAPGLVREIRCARPDVVHVQCYQTFVAPLAMATAARARIPYFLTFHGGGHDSRLRNALRTTQLRVLRPMLARAARLVATAEWEIEHYSTLLGLPGDKFVLIPNGGDLPTPAEGAPRAGGTLIASLGRLERFKGHQLAVAALPHVIAEVPDARLWIAGTGPYGAELEQLAKRLGVRDRVEVRGLADRAEYASRLSDASVVALMSEFETHPMAAAEALSLGAPVLVTHDGGGLSELANKGYARGVDRKAGPREHAAEIVRLIRDPPPRPSERLIQSWDECVDALVAIYEGACRGRDLAS
jgi:glycosyltransferase involved in cell wall biosynthesis